MLHPCSIRKLKYGHGEKNRVRDYCRFWLYYTQNMKKSHFSKSVCVCVCLSVYVSVDFFSMANDNCRKFKQNQIIFCIQPWFVEDSRPIVFGEDRWRERGSLIATFYVLTRVIFNMTNDNCRKFKQNQLRFCIPFWIIKNSRSVDFFEDRLRERGSLPATFYVLTRVFFLWRTITAVN